MSESGTSARVSCPRCGAAFACDPGGACWCATLPRRAPVPLRGDARCLCLRCLDEALRAGGGESRSPGAGEV